MFYLSYVLAELRRRRGRTILTALGLAVGVALVVTVNALSSGLNSAQAHVLAPLTGVGTDMSVTRPLVLSTTGGNPFAALTPAERAQLQQENGGARVGIRNIAKPGQKFNIDRFRATSQLSFPASTVLKVQALSGVSGAAGALTLTDLHLSGTVPKQSAQSATPQGGFGPGGGAPGGGLGGSRGGGFFGPNDINIDSRTVTGIDPNHSSLATVTPGQIVKGRYFGSAATTYDAVLSTSYAESKNLTVGSTVSVGGKSFHVIGLAAAPLGGTQSDIYVDLATLQKLAGFVGRVNTMQVRAATGSEVGTVQNEVKRTLVGAQVTTAQDLAKRISGSLTDARNLSGTLGTGLEIVGLLAAILIAILLTLASVTKRTREIGTLKAIGWSQSLVVRQISLESSIQGLVGGVLGALLGIAGAQVVTAMGLTLKATVAAPAAAASPFEFGRFAAAAATSAGSTTVHITAPVNLALIAAAVALAAAGGLVAGAVGGMRAARLRPAAALRTVE